MAIQRGERLPISDCLAVDNEVFMAFAGTLKANVGKLLDQSLVNEIFEMLRDWACRLEPAHVGNGQTPPNTD